MEDIAAKGADTQAAIAAETISTMILSGDLKGGERLNIRDLVKQTGIGATPLREGVSRLIDRGFVKALDRRGFRVTETSAEDLEDIMRTRLPLESEALRLAIEKGDDQWEAKIVSTLHRLVNFMNWAPHDPREAALGFDAVHKAFHTALISACGSERMLAFLDMLYDQGFRYRHLMLTHHDPRQRLQGAQRIEEHNVLAELAIKRKPREAVEALQRHLSTFSGDVFKDKS
ncbi:MAG: FCD domain-containing protein [Rhizobiaceae bacterium]|nr:FCD domain-containing protein [Rhizobiaceae bacterium]